MGYKSPTKAFLHVGCGSFSPLDSTTYYFGGFIATVPSTTAAQRQATIPHRGKIIAATISSVAIMVTGTAEDIVLVLRLNNTTDYAIATVGSATVNRDFENFAMNVDVVDGDKVELKMTTPAWVTNPDGFRLEGDLVISIE